MECHSEPLVPFLLVEAHTYLSILMHESISAKTYNIGPYEYRTTAHKWLNAV